MNESISHDDAIRLILNLDMDQAELKQLEQALSRLHTDDTLAQRLEELQRLKQALAAPDQMMDEPAGGAELFQQRLINKIEKTPVTPKQHRPAFVGRFITGFAGGLAAAAVLLVGMLSISWWSDEDSVNSQNTINAIDSSVWLPKDPEQQRALLAQLAGFYDGRAGWYAVTGQDARMGLADHPIDTSEPLVTRLSLEAPDGSIIRTDLVLFPGQDITLEVPRPDGPPVRYSIKVNPPHNGYNTMRLKLTISMDDGPSMTTEIPLTGNTVKEVGRLLTDQGQYQLRLGLADAS